MLSLKELDMPTCFRFLIPFVAAAMLAACGGGDDGTAQVFKVTSGDGSDIPGAISPSDLGDLDSQHRMLLASVGVTVESSMCRISTLVVDGFPPVLFAYEIPVEHVPAAVAAGFGSVRPGGFNSLSRPCVNPTPIFPV
jgi:hypothetical protein